MLETRLTFRLISYWIRLCPDDKDDGPVQRDSQAYLAGYFDR